MNAPPVLRPLRAILQRRLPSKPEQATEAAKDQAPSSESPAGTAQAINADSHLEPPERVEAAQGDLKINQAEPDANEIDIPGDVITNFEMPAEAAVPKLDEAYFKSAFQQFRAVSAEVQAGIEEVVARQIEAHEDNGSTGAEVAEAVEALADARILADFAAGYAAGNAEAAVASGTEAVNAAEEVRETEEADIGEVDVPQTEAFTATEAQDVVNEGAAKKIDSYEKDLGTVLEDVIEERTEDGAARLVESREEEDDIPAEPSRLPRNVQAFYLQPLRRQAQYGVPSCDLQLRSYSVRPLESFCDFALRAAYYLGLPAYGPTPLPKIIERWTVPKASFIFKKSQENFERITRRRLIQIRDGHPETVQIWLAFLQKHQQAGVGMKANVWEFSSLDVAKEMDEAYEQAKPMIDKKLSLLGQDKEFATVQKVDEILTTERYKLAGGR
ncbi:hypothetical protein VMCG_00613 [Cytospora schulzeri]|uniref:Small ribosomal subunit protein uS10m n=1 Tax=Cytospora schulzeri TaxID=448051 RepID=A0A423X951_9PEZI|nr:hypothetical protein VMCG_00613 [Valsa malicola]